MTRRTLLRLAAITGPAAARAFGASDFWNRKKPSEWSASEIEELTTHSPWAKQVNADFQNDTQFDPNAAPAPRGNPGQFEIGRNAHETPRGAQRRQPVVIRWASAQPIRDALGIPLPKELDGRYVISVTGLLLGVMDARKRKTEGPAVVEDGGESPRDRMIEQLKASAVLEARGKEPTQPGVVLPARGEAAAYLFGFSKEFLLLTGSDREVQFTLQTPFIALRTKFEPKDMFYRGALAL